jgi:hypothetical protein
MSVIKAFSIDGKMINKSTETGKWWVSEMENDCFRGAIASLYDFVVETNANCDSAYDWVCDQCGIDTFVADTWAWDCFYSVFDSTRD